MIAGLVANLCEHTQMIKLYTLNGRFVWYVNYSSIMLLNRAGRDLAVQKVFSHFPPKA